MLWCSFHLSVVTSCQPMHHWVRTAWQTVHFLCKALWELPGAKLSLMTCLDFVTLRTELFHPRFADRPLLHANSHCFSAHFISCLVCKCTLRVICFSHAHKRSRTFKNLITRRWTCMYSFVMVTTEQLLFSLCSLLAVFRLCNHECLKRPDSVNLGVKN